MLHFMLLMVQALISSPLKVITVCHCARGSNLPMHAHVVLWLRTFPLQLLLISFCHIYVCRLTHHNGGILANNAFIYASAMTSRWLAYNCIYFANGHCFHLLPCNLRLSGLRIGGGPWTTWALDTLQVNANNPFSKPLPCCMAHTRRSRPNYTFRKPKYKSITQ